MGTVQGGGIQEEMELTLDLDEVSERHYILTIHQHMLLRLIRRERNPRDGAFYDYAIFTIYDQEICKSDADL